MTDTHITKQIKLSDELRQSLDVVRRVFMLFFFKNRDYALVSALIVIVVTLLAYARSDNLFMDFPYHLAGIAIFVWPSLSSEILLLKTLPLSSKTIPTAIWLVMTLVTPIVFTVTILLSQIIPSITSADSYTVREMVLFLPFSIVFMGNLVFFCELLNRYSGIISKAGTIRRPHFMIVYVLYALVAFSWGWAALCLKYEKYALAYSYFACTLIIFFLSFYFRDWLAMNNKGATRLRRTEKKQANILVRTFRKLTWINQNAAPFALVLVLMLAALYSGLNIDKELQAKRPLMLLGMMAGGFFLAAVTFGAVNNTEPPRILRMLPLSSKRILLRRVQMHAVFSALYALLMTLVLIKMYAYSLLLFPLFFVWLLGVALLFDGGRADPEDPDNNWGPFLFTKIFVAILSFCFLMNDGLPGFISFATLGAIMTCMGGIWIHKNITRNSEIYRNKRGDEF